MLLNVSYLPTSSYLGRRRDADLRDSFSDINTKRMADSYVVSLIRSCHRRRTELLSTAAVSAHALYRNPPLTP
jgi:hypothetical protein